MKRVNNMSVITRELIDAVLQNQGSYYLPYQLHATTEQFQKAYSQFKLKARLDPQNKFSNMLLKRYRIETVQ